MTGRVTLQALMFHEALLHTVTQTSHQGEQSADRQPPRNYQWRDPWHLLLWTRLRVAAWTVSFIPAPWGQLTPKVSLWELPYIKGLDLRELIYIFIYIHIYIFARRTKGSNESAQSKSQGRGTQQRPGRRIIWAQAVKQLLSQNRLPGGRKGALGGTRGGR